LKEKSLLAVCGIARPERFFSMLEKEGIKPRLSLTFPDHHTYPNSTRKKIFAAFHAVKTHAVITTEKDVFKLGALKKADMFPVYFNKIDLQVEENFYKELLLLKKEG
jgi:tetraacyldisaccharide 4'-kinase